MERVTFRDSDSGPPGQQAMKQEKTQRLGLHSKSQFYQNRNMDNAISRDRCCMFWQFFSNWTVDNPDSIQINIHSSITEVISLVRCLFKLNWYSAFTFAYYFSFFPCCEYDMTGHVQLNMWTRVISLYNVFYLDFIYSCWLSFESQLWSENLQ